MPNPNPSPQTRWKPGQSGNLKGRPEGSVVQARNVHVTSLSEAKAKVGSFRGSPREFLLAAMVDPTVDHHTRLAAAGQLLRDKDLSEIDDKLSPAERKRRIKELFEKLAMDDEPPVIDGVAE
jgi:hypothetical protein